MTWPNRLKVWPRDAGQEGLLVFKTEYEACCEWAFLVKDAALPDPPVYHGSTENRLPVQEWKLQNETFSGFMLELLMVRSIHFANRFFACRKKADEGTWAKVATHFQDVGFPAWQEYGRDCRLLGGQDTLLLVHSDTPWGDRHDLCLNARTAEARQKVREALAIEWDCVEDGEQVEPGTTTGRPRE
jgi:hypothetical protein